MEITKKVIYSGEGFDFTFEPIEDSISIKKTKNGYEVRYLTPDKYPENPFENDEGLGNFYHWNNDREEFLKYCEALGYDHNTTEKIGKENPDVVKIDKYEHSQVYYSVEGEGYNCQWDTSHSWAVWLPNNCLLEDLKRFKTKASRRKRCIELARQACEIFNQWANGEVYCIVKENFDTNKEQIDYDVVGGYYGYKEALKSLETDI